MRLRTVGLMLGAGLLAAAPAWADRWDNTTSQDDTASTTFNELHHGVVQDHDWSGDTDQDWYRFSTRGRSSYEVVVDGLGSDLNTIYIDFERYVYSDTTTVLDYFTTAGTGYQLSLRWQNTNSSSQSDRIKIAATNTGNSTNDGYVVKAYETRVAIPRYNNSGGQITVLLCQNLGDSTNTGSVYLWSAAGSLVTNFNYSVAANGLLAQNLASVNSGAANNTSGTVTVTQSGRFGDLNCKSVALEPATGFSFDSPGVYKPL